RNARSRLRALMSVDLSAHQGDRLLIYRGGIPSLDGGEIRLSLLVTGARAPAMPLEEIRRGVQRILRHVEISAAIGEDVLRQELGLADLAVHRAARAR